MAISTYNTHLKWKDLSPTSPSPATLTEQVIIKDYPDMIGDPNLIDTTTLSDSQQTNILGIKTSSVLPFTVNLENKYSTNDTVPVETTLNTVLATEGKPMEYELTFANGVKLTWQGSHKFGIPGKGVDNVIEMKVNIVNSTAVTITESTLLEEG